MANQNNPDYGDLEEIVVISEELVEEAEDVKPSEVNLSGDRRGGPRGSEKQKRWRDTSPSYASIAAESTSLYEGSGSPPR